MRDKIDFETSRKSFFNKFHKKTSAEKRNYDFKGELIIGEIIII
jgi:hypothetical protein